jgi:hypothetical protein
MAVSNGDACESENDGELTFPRRAILSNDRDVASCRVGIDVKMSAASEIIRTGSGVAGAPVGRSGLAVARILERILR